MKRNITTNGRLMRGALGLLCLCGAAWLSRDHRLLAVILLLLGIFTIFEAVRGWCAFRACGIKTPL
ncbi:MAG: YgaP-like transmembrane domain [Chthoniobacterales bacterium]